jgi:hypothetical protein
LDRTFFARAAHPVVTRLSDSAATAPAIGAASMVLRAELVPLRQGRLPLPTALGEPDPEVAVSATAGRTQPVS